MAERPPEPASPPAPSGTGSRVPGGRQVLIIAAIVVLAVLAVEAVSVNVAAVGDVFGRFPTTIVVLIVVTIVVLASLAFRRRTP